MSNYSLKNKYYNLDAMYGDGEERIFHISLIRDCDVYNGHFPGRPVCPGVCNMQIIKECAELMTSHKLTIARIKQCRLTTVVTPEMFPKLRVKIKIDVCDNNIGVLAAIDYSGKLCMEYNGIMNFELSAEDCF